MFCRSVEVLIIYLVTLNVSNPRMYPNYFAISKYFQRYLPLFSCLRNLHIAEYLERGFVST